MPDLDSDTLTQVYDNLRKKPRGQTPSSMWAPFIQHLAEGSQHMSPMNRDTVLGNGQGPSTKESWNSMFSSPTERNATINANWKANAEAPRLDPAKVAQVQKVTGIKPNYGVPMTPSRELGRDQIMQGPRGHTLNYDEAHKLSGMFGMETPAPGVKGGMTPYGPVMVTEDKQGRQGPPAPESPSNGLGGQSLADAQEQFIRELGGESGAKRPAAPVEMFGPPAPVETFGPPAPTASAPQPKPQARMFTPVGAAVGFNHGPSAPLQEGPRYPVKPSTEKLVQGPPDEEGYSKLIPAKAHVDEEGYSKPAYQHKTSTPTGEMFGPPAPIPPQVHEGQTNSFYPLPVVHTSSNSMFGPPPDYNVTKSYEDKAKVDQLQRTMRKFLNPQSATYAPF